MWKLAYVKFINDNHERQQLAEGLFVALSRLSMRTGSTEVDGIVHKNLDHKTVDLGRWITYTRSQ